MSLDGTVILVPRRDGIVDRDALWAWCRPWWEEQFPGVPIIEGHHDVGPFNRSAAVNAAARAGGDWTTAILIDSDVVTDAGNVRAAIPRALGTGQMVVPFTVRYNLSPRGTQRILKGDRGSWKPYIARTFYDQHSSVVVIPRTLYDAIGGFDEGFRGWGMEDSAFAVACETFAGRPLERMDGECWHLYHRSSPGEKHGSPTHRRNAARLERYHVARGDKEILRAMVEEGRVTPEEVPTSIPRILHRVVPEVTDPVADGYWQKWQMLHPDWRFITHRDPLDPEEWPLTSDIWKYVQAGAQLADLVRLEAVLKWGGVYVDQDMEPYRSLEPLLGVEMFAAWEDHSTVPNAVFGARPNHPAVSRALDMAVQRVRQRKGIWEAGPGVFTTLLPNRPDVLLLPPGSFYPYHYKEKERAGEDHMRQQPWCFAAHHWWHSWKGKK